tara:strand:- start:1251 stop:3593 length:2343 start_codon:yes stop_codon:yes gene_type:complete
MNKRQKEIFGLVLIVFSILSIVSLLGHDITENPSGLSKGYNPNNLLGFFGIYISHYYYLSLGYTSIVFPIALLIIGYANFSDTNIKKILRIVSYILIIGLLFSLFMSYLSYFNGNQLLINYFSGFIGLSIFNFIVHFLGIIGATIFLVVSILLLITNIYKLSLYDLFKHFNYYQKIIIFKILNLVKDNYFFIKSLIHNKKKNNPNIMDEDSSSQNYSLDNNFDDNLKSFEEIEDLNEEIHHSPEETVIEKSDDKNDYKSIFEEDSTIENNENVAVDKEDEIIEGDLDNIQKQNSKYFQYKLPSLDYLQEPIEIAKHNEDDLREKGQQLKYALNTFGVDGEIVKISPGPIISLFEIEPAVGVRVNKFINLSDDLARVMKAQRVRIIAPIPGSKSVGIELPNQNISTVYLKSILNSQKFIESKSKLTIALGKTTSGDAYIFDLCKMPHLLVAGATGSGKSVCINTIILSILYKAKPDEVKFILLDPKKLELSTYKSLVGYHLITSSNLDEYVMTTAENSVAILNSAIIEMERRFQVFSDARVRNITEYHGKQKVDNSLEKIPYIVVLIDELADLMMTSGRAVEEPITRLAQKARAVGIHLVVATQRPSVDVITGLIKSNFPSRISFLVSSKIDSRTILDQMGAEKLLGRGDMLFLLPGSASPIRLHNAFVNLDEIEKIMSHVSSQPKPDEIKLPEYEVKNNNSDISLDEDHDELLKDAAKLVVDYQQASVSLLQRKFRIGYSRAGRLIDELEALGIVSSYNGSKAREILVDPSYLNEVFGEE